MYLLIYAYRSRYGIGTYQARRPFTSRFLKHQPHSDEEVEEQGENVNQQQNPESSNDNKANPDTANDQSDHAEDNNQKKWELHW